MHWSILVLTLWLVYAALFVEETHSLVRGAIGPTRERQAPRDGRQTIRIVSLNCAGSPRAAAEVAEHNPDIVLLQESPGRDDLASLSRDLFGGRGTFLWGGDASALARGKLTPRSAELASHFVHAEVKLPSGLQVDIVSVRLSAPVSRLDFWTRGFWNEHCDTRVKHRAQVQDLMRHVPRTGPLIIGGDFNASPDDAALSQMRARLVDTFQQSGRGWGNTATNHYPLFRVDQIWASRDFLAEAVTAHETLYSDHRMVVCDVALGQ
jgi:endonuclease/exonuclease/phosphatase (EEP) superfamily protein YafD